MQIEGEGSNGRAPLPTPIACEACDATWQPSGGFIAVRKQGNVRVWHCLDCYLVAERLPADHGAC